MVPALVLGVSLLAAASAGSPAPVADDLASYQKAARSVGRDPDAHVRLALWCEARGLSAERTKHLTLAVLCDPSHATARGLMGLMAYRGKWVSPGVVARRMQEDERRTALLAEYNARRD